MTLDGPVGMVAEFGPEGIDGDGVVGVATGRTVGACGVLRVVISGTDGRIGTAVCWVCGSTFQDPASGRTCLSLPKELRPPRIPYGAPRGAGVYPRGPAGGTTGPLFSERLWAEMEEGGPEGAVKFRDGPVGGALNTAAGPRGGDLAIIGRGAGDRSLGVDRAEPLSRSRSLKARDCGGDRSR